jgi:hypothetical protein
MTTTTLTTTLRLGALGVFALAIGCGATAPQRQAALAAGEFGRAIEGEEATRHIATFDALDFDVFSHQHWDRLHESHAADITVTWPDGHDTHGIDTHIHDLQQLFIHAPDTAILVHPIRIANGDWTAVTGVMTGTFTRPMPLPNGRAVPPTGRSFSLPMATVAHWRNGVMDHEWLYWDNQTYMTQLGIGQ